VRYFGTKSSTFDTNVFYKYSWSWCFDVIPEVAGLIPTVVRITFLPLILSWVYNIKTHTKIHVSCSYCHVFNWAVQSLVLVDILFKTRLIMICFLKIYKQRVSSGIFVFLKEAKLPFD
jgi:hypothetical protein